MRRCSKAGRNRPATDLLGLLDEAPSDGLRFPASLADVKALVLQHIACEPPGVFEDVLRERDAELHRVELDEGEPLPDWRKFDAIVAMGGPMSANDDAELPWLTGEKQLVSEAVRAGKPYWGVCLGVQLLAASLGGRVYPGPEPEVGLLPVSLTGEARSDPVFGEAPHELVTLQWHGDTFDLPDGAVRLASSPAYPNQAFRLGRAYGVQFHLEVSAEMAREWAEVPEYVASLERTLGREAAPAFLGSIEERAGEMRTVGRALFERWLDRVVA
jgi:GMP synthase (glutamine-hydrolysing)